MTDDDWAAQVMRNYRAAKEGRPKFAQALGTLVMSWGDLERDLYRVLMHYAGVSEPVGRAIFANIRVQTIVQHLDAIADNTGMDGDRRQHLKTLLSQVEAIGKARNLLMHFTTTVQSFNDDPAIWNVHNRQRVKQPGKATNIEASTELLDRMCADLLKICWHLEQHLHEGPFNPISDQTTPAEASTWLYR